MNVSALASICWANHSSYPHAIVNGVQLSALQIIIKILRERTLIGSTTASGFIVGATRAVCFQDAPLYSICQNIDFERLLVSEKQSVRVRYEPYGLMFPKPYAYSLDARPVFYERTGVGKELFPEDQWWRIVPFDMSSPDAYIDWTHEREWRAPGDIHFDIGRATVVVPNSTTFKHFFEQGARGGENITKLVRTAVPLGSDLHVSRNRPW